MAKHTPGPWLIGSHPNKILANPTKTFEVVAEAMPWKYVDGVGVHEISEDEAKANAKLISCCPELLEACKEYMLYISTLKGEAYLKRAAELQELILRAEG